MVSLNETLAILNNEEEKITHYLKSEFKNINIRLVKDLLNNEYSIELSLIKNFIPFNTRNDKGFIFLITGPMFSGKTTAFINILNLIKIKTDYKIQVFKPVIDTRYAKNKVINHNKISIDCQNITTSSRFSEQINKDTKIVAIDEIQFLDEGIISHLEKLRDEGKIIILTGLNLDFKRESFNLMPELLSIADYIEKLSSICAVCGNPATLTQRIVNGEPAHYRDEIILIGESDYYESRCRDCHKVKGIDDLEKD